MNTWISTLILLAGMAQSSADTYSLQTSLSQNSLDAPAVSSNQQILTAVAAPAEAGSFSGVVLPEQGHESVLVVPTPDLPPESVSDLTEDLTVMCRIFDKSLPPARSGGLSYGGGGGYGGTSGGGGGYGGRSDVFRFGLGPQSQGTQGLYLDGYGALFFIHVDYPLVPTEPAEPAQAKPKESTDMVWSQTVKEMSGQPAEEGPAARTAPVYDSQRVENLKKTLTKTLAHASNIRMRRPQDAITLVVGALDETRSWGPGRRPGPMFGGSGSGSTGGQPGAGSARAAVRNPTGALLILRVTKADVDALAKGQLTAAQFAEKVQSLWAPLDQGTPETVTVPARIGVNTGSSGTGARKR
jgi:hypothetical protein